MIEDEKIGLKVAENPEEAMLAGLLKNSESRLRELKMSLELEGVLFEYLKKKTEKRKI